MPAPPLPLSVATDKAGVLTRFTEVDFDNDLFVPADAARLEGPADNFGVPIVWHLLKQSRRVVVTSGAYPFFTGQLTESRKTKSAREKSISLEIMNANKDLVDCGTPFNVPLPRASTTSKYLIPPPQGIFGYRIGTVTVPGTTLSAWATKLFAPLGIKVAPGGSTAQIPRSEPIKANATEPVWSMVESVARQVGAWLWCDELGIVHVDELARFYAAPPVGWLVDQPGNPANNITRYELIDTPGDRYSHVHVKGCGATRAAAGNLVTGVLNAPVEAMAVDPEMSARGYNRPLIIQDARARNLQQALNRAIRELQLRMVKGTKIVIHTPGWLNDSLQPWQTTQMVRCSIAEEMIDDTYFIAGRRFVRNTTEGTQTILTLIQPGVL